mmetsp:Transcript_66347/g.135089  ORF Transcript_66347/g.135089 Transcript_66347/m.135089 type:complete len:307 (+) Transcript_66347:42-962(+)
MGGPCDCDGKTHEFMDNFYECRFKDEAGKMWPTAEHNFQAAKFLAPEDEPYRERIREACGGMAAWKCGNMLSSSEGRTGPTLRKDWEIVKVEEMYFANLRKYSQSDDLKNALTHTKGKISATGGLFWKTWNEILLERIREELRSPIEQDVLVMKARRQMMESYRRAMEKGDSRLAGAITQSSARREVLDLAKLGSVAWVQGFESLGEQPWSTWMTAKFKTDPCMPEVNGEAHFINEEGGHLYLGNKRGKFAWVLDDSLDPKEVTGTAYCMVAEDQKSLGALMATARSWQVFVGNSHTGVELVVKGC